MDRIKQEVKQHHLRQLFIILTVCLFFGVKPAHGQTDSINGDYGSFGACGCSKNPCERELSLKDGKFKFSLQAALTANVEGEGEYFINWNDSTITFKYTSYKEKVAKKKYVDKTHYDEVFKISNAHPFTFYPYHKYKK